MVRQTVAVLRLRLVVLSVGLVLAACVSESNPTNLPVTAGPTLATKPAASPSGPAPTPFPTARMPDRYPDEMLGMPFGLRSTHDGGVLIRRIGVPDGITVPASQRVLGVAGDRLVTARRDGRATMLTVSTIEFGDRVAEPVRWPGKVEDATVVGSYVVARAGGQRLGGVAGLIAISTVDGGVRWIAEPIDVTGLAAPYRTIGTAISGDAIATTICEQGMESLHDCRRTSIIDVATGAVLSNLDAGDYPVIAFDADWLLVSDHYGTLGVVDPAGRPLWSADNLVAWTAFAPDDRTVLAESREGEDGPVLVQIDPLTGSQDVLTEPSGSGGWYLWAAYSTGTVIALGLEPGSPCRPEFGGCDPAALPVIGGAVLDLETRTLTPDAFHITVMP